ncbi:MAG: ATP-binding cassette domain-containing protein, partial [Alphaproteobacteria bacterium]|nr:ATP-binding cassette domain-containing protein [Alphaproteobacteria bacterium]
DILDATIEEGCELFESVRSIASKLNTLNRVGLGYVKIGQSATTLSGGEAQRIKLSKELSRVSTSKTIYILDEPTTGLHFHDIARLMEILQSLVEQGNTVLIIEHNLDVIKCSDWVIDIGPEGGNGGGQIIGVGTPETIAALPHSYTGQFLAAALEQRKAS